MWSSAPSSTSVAVPLTEIHRYGPGVDDGQRDSPVVCDVRRLRTTVRRVERHAFVVDVDPDHRRVRRSVRAQIGDRSDERFLEELALGGRQALQTIATMRSIAPLAFAAISGSTVTTYFQSRSESRSFSSVIIFM